MNAIVAAGRPMVPAVPPGVAGAAAMQAGDASHLQHLTFSLRGEMFAVGILNVREIIEYGNITTIPMMPDFIRGVINLRGAVVPVIDLSARFGNGVTEVGRRTCIVIIEIAADDFTHEVGIVVDAVSEVMEIPAGDIEPPPSFGAKIRADFIAGMARGQGKFVIILAIDRVLSVDDIATLAGAGAKALQLEAAAA